MSNELIPGYQIYNGSGLDQSLLLKFMVQTYRELYPEQNFSHLSRTIEQYLSHQTPLWWVEPVSPPMGKGSFPPIKSGVGCLWMGNAIDQMNGERYAHIFLLYVIPTHRRQGIGSALMHHAETWAKERGDRKIGLQVFLSNQPALALYQKLGYTTQSLLMLKSL